MLIIVAIIAVAALAIVGVMQHIDGALLTAAFAIIGGLAGWTGAKLVEHRKEINKR